MSTYLSTPELIARVHLGKEVEQWLSYEKNKEYAFIRWLVIGREKDQFTVTYYESFDEGDEDFYDVSEFSVLDPEDTPYGITHEFDSVEKVLVFAVTTYGASADKFVAGGMIQEEYIKHLC
ncbi:hypothetical protein [Hymenobacter swuensis]|uniref:hypothetical protein n=1 Tax=Hymenobacter swuensis TaxID=1446467 RepID=UPI0005C78720|nr:hypothetical protein [Hymenobacter swuensis]